jgi:hypothetical protein
VSKLLWVDNGETTVAAVELSLTDYRLYRKGRDGLWWQITPSLRHDQFVSPHIARLDEPIRVVGEDTVAWLNDEVAALIEAQVIADGEIVDCSEKVRGELFEVTAEYLLNDEVRDNYEVAYWPGLPGEGGYWAVEKGNVEANPDRVRWFRVEYPERGGTVANPTVVWVADGRTHQEAATYPLVIREVAAG